MTMRKRSLVLASLFAAALLLYGAAKHYSASLVLYVVEQSLMQKAPVGIRNASLRARFRAHVFSAPDKAAQMEKLLRISEYLEKVQHVSSEQIDQLLVVDK